MKQILDRNKIENELKEIKKYLERKTQGKVEYELKNNDDNEEYIEVIVKFEKNRSLIFRFDEVDFCGVAKRKIKEEMKFHIEEYLKNLKK